MRWQRYVRRRDEEDSIEKLPVTPGPIVLEQLGDLLREQGHPELAAKEFEVALASSPGRLGAMQGAAECAKSAVRKLLSSDGEVPQRLKGVRSNVPPLRDSGALPHFTSTRSPRATCVLGYTESRLWRWLIARHLPTQTQKFSSHEAKPGCQLRRLSMRRCCGHRTSAHLDIYARDLPSRGFDVPRCVAKSGADASDRAWPTWTATVTGLQVPMRDASLGARGPQAGDSRCATVQDCRSATAQTHPEAEAAICPGWCAWPSRSKGSNAFDSPYSRIIFTRGIQSVRSP